MNDFIGIDTITFLRDTTRVKTKLFSMLDLCPDEIVDAINPFIVEVMQEYDPYKKITRLQAYGDVMSEPHPVTGTILRGYRSWKQFRKVRALVAEGKIPYRRTMAMQRGWRIVGEGRTSFVANEADAARYTMGDDGQTSLHDLMGWRKVSARLQANRRKIIARANAGARAAIKKAGL